MPVADPVERRDHVARELAGLGEHRIKNIVVEIVDALGARLCEARGMLEREGDVGDGRAVGHEGASWARSVEQTGPGGMDFGDVSPPTIASHRSRQYGPPARWGVAKW